MRRRKMKSILALSLLASSSICVAEVKKVVRSIDDLPQSSYPVPGSVADVLTGPPQLFEATVAPIRADIEHILSGYDITDAATLRTILQAKLGGEIASGKEDRAALATIEALRANQNKADARLISGLMPQAFLEARLIDGTLPGSCPRDFQNDYVKHLNALPWDVVGTAETRMKSLAQLASVTFMVGMIPPNVQSTLDRTHALSSEPAYELMGGRVNMDVIVPCRAQILAATEAYVRAHAVQKPDIWAARDAVLPAGMKLTPVRVAIWDSGFDASQFPGQLLLSDEGTPIVAPAYDVDDRPTQGQLAPLSPKDMAAYPQIVADTNGVSDLQTGIDSPAAAAVRQRLAAMSQAQMKDFMQEDSTLEMYMHGTHVAGLAAHGDPAIRMVSARMTYDTRPVPSPPTDDLMKRQAATYGETIAWLRAHHIRVVNMSWWSRPSAYETELEQNGIGKTAEERKALARHYFTIERDGLYAALKSAPDILFVTIAGNSNSDNAFDETIPSSFKLPNLLVVGAVDQSGQQTNFTSTGQNIAVYADGYQVESVVPGGAKVRMSGTSMAAPEATNLAAKLLAVDPKLSPEQLIAIITKTADAGESPAIRRINPRLAMASVTAGER